MAKRYTDTNIWDKQWFRLLSPKMKEAWRYLYEKCNHAGGWEIDLDTMSHFVGEPVSLEDLKTHLGARLDFIGDNKIYIKGFVEFQYNCSIDELNPANRVHRSVIQMLEKMGLRKPLASPLEGAKDKDTYKDKAKDKETPTLRHNATKRFENNFDPTYRAFEKAMREEFGFTPQFQVLLPDIYERWKNNQDELFAFIDGRKAALERSGANTLEDRQAWLRRALIAESGLAERGA